MPAQWTTKRAEVVTASRGDGSFYAEVPLYDDGVKQLTITLDITPERAVRVLVDGEPGAVLSDLRAWSRI